MAYSLRTNRSAFTAVSLLILTILLVTLASLFFYLTFNQVAYENNARTNTASLTAQSLIDKVDRNFYERFGDVQAFAFNRLAVESVERDTVEPGLQEFINTMTSYYVLYDIMMVCNKDGKVLAVNTQDKSGKPLNSRGLLNISMANTPWHQRCISTQGPEGRSVVFRFCNQCFCGQCLWD